MPRILRPLLANAPYLGILALLAAVPPFLPNPYHVQVLVFVGIYVILTLSLNLLNGLGCDVAQGFYLSHPLPCQQLERWYKNEAGTNQWAADPAVAIPKATSPVRIRVRTLLPPLMWWGFYPNRSRPPRLPA